ncbi:MAG: efflux RND transporter permease subunit [Thermoanaerobaculia bacterium]
MNLAEIAIRQKTVTLVLTLVMLGGGMVAYQGMSRLEDPEFTIKAALVVTPYPGAAAAEVEEEVTDEIELAVQKLGQLEEIESKSDRGLSTVTVTIQDKYDKSTLPQVWDELRRKVDDAQKNLPPGAGPSIVIDDYGDVFGIFIVIYGDEYSYAELKQVVDLLRKELLLVQDVAKIETFGERVEAVYIELDRDRMSQLGIPTSAIVDELRQKNLVTDAGRVRVGTEFITVNPTGGISTVEQFSSLLIRGGDRQIYLRDVATVRRGYVEPQDHLIRFDGKTAIGLGISTASGGNVVKMGEALKRRLTELAPQLPLGVELGIVSLQSDAVSTAISGFVLSLLEAVAIVIAVLVIFMGLRSALLIGFILLLTIVGSFIFLADMGVALERISLGALIIALGMLVDNAIVVVDGMLIKLQKGVDAERAASEVVSQSAMPLLGATFVAILAFAAIGTSQDSTGEFCRSLFQVVMVSLLLSWVTAVTVTPLLGVMFLRAPKSGDGGGDPYAGGFYGVYKGFLRGAIRGRWLVVALVIVIFGTALWAFGFVEQSFFPPSTRPQFMVDFWMPQGIHIDETASRVAEIEKYLLEQEGVTHVSSMIGKGALRFLLTYAPEKLNPAYAQMLVDVDDAKKIGTLAPALERHLAENFPEALSYASKFQLGPGSTGKVQARFSGPDPDVLRRLASDTAAIFHADPDAKAVKTDWRQRVKVLRPVLAEEQANLNGIQRPDVARALLEGFQGFRVGVYREGGLLLPIVLRAAEEQRSDVTSIQQLQIWSPAAGRMIPLRQVVSGFATTYEDEIIIRKNRKRTLIVFADPIEGAASDLFGRLRPQVEALELAEGYTLEWGGEYEDSGNAQAALVGSIPLFILLMVLVTIVIFNSLKQPLVIWLCVPLALIGVTAGLLATNQPFGFMSLLGFLSLIGMLIKNAIVLVDEINFQEGEGKALLAAIVDSGASRLRPVAMAASTTALGMIPLIFDAFFVAMAITIIAGLLFATVLTMVVLPVIYAIVFRVPSQPVREPGS